MPLLAFLAGFILKQHPDLLSMARFVLDVGRWREIQGGVADVSWLDSHEILFSNGGRDSAPLPGKQDSNLGNYSDWAKIDTRTKKITSLDGISKFATSNDTYQHPLADPTGKHLLWTFIRNDQPTWCLTDLSGREIAAWPRHAMARLLDADESESEATWSLDGRFLLESELFYDQEPAVVRIWRRSVNNPYREEELPKLPAPGNFELWPKVADIGKGMAVWTPYGPPLLDVKPHGIQPAHMSSVIWNLSHPEAAKVQALTIDAWGDVRPEGFSSDRKRILWTATGKNFGSESLWVSGVDGSHLREIGTIRFDDKEPESSSQFFGCVQWIPGTHKVSFIYQRKLYEVNADWFLTKPAHKSPN